MPSEMGQGRHSGCYLNGRHAVPSHRDGRAPRRHHGQRAQRRCGAHPTFLPSACCSASTRRASCGATPSGKRGCAGARSGTAWWSALSSAPRACLRPRELSSRRRWHRHRLEYIALALATPPSLYRSPLPSPPTPSPQARRTGDLLLLPETHEPGCSVTIGSGGELPRRWSSGPYGGRMDCRVLRRPDGID